MKTIWDGDGNDNTATVKALLLANRTIKTVDLYQILLVSGGQSRSNVGFVARWTNHDGPIRSTYLEENAPDPIAQSGTFYPVRMQRPTIESVVGLRVSEMTMELYPADWTNSRFNGAGQLYNTDLTLSLPSYRDAFSLLTSDKATVVETLKIAALAGELDQAFLYIYRGFLPTPITASNSGDVDTLGVMPVFTGYIKQVEATRTSLRFTIAALLDYLTTIQTPTQLIETGDRGGQMYVQVATPPGVAMTVQAGSTTQLVIGAGALQTNGLFSDGRIIFTYGSYLTRPAQSTVARHVRTNFQTAGKNYFYLTEPLPIAPLSNGGSGDTFIAYPPGSLDSANSVNGKGFPYVPSPETPI